MYKYSLILLIILASIAGGCQQKTADSSDTKPPPVQPADRMNAVNDNNDSWDIIREAKQIGMLPENERQQMRNFFASFKKAVLSYKGNQAALMMSVHSLDYYENVLQTLRIKIHQPEVYEKTIKPKLAVSIRTMVEIMNQRLTADFVDSANATKLYEVGFNQGWIGYRSLQTGSIDNMRLFEINGHRYVMADFFTQNSIKDNYISRIGFVEENGQWKVDLVPLFIGVEYAINDYIITKNIDVNGSLEQTVKNTQSAMDPDNWPVSAHINDGFEVRFPRIPLYGEDNDGLTHVYTSHHYIYGQFDVRVRSYETGDTDNPWNNQTLQKRHMVGFLKSLGSELPSCSDEKLPKADIVRCDFKVSLHGSQGKAVWVFTARHEFLLLNLARTDKYHDDAAVAFIKSFKYNE